MLFLASALLATSTVLASGVSPHGYGPHHEAAARSYKNTERNDTGNALDARGGYEYNNQRATWWTVGEVACGGSYSTDGFWVALSQESFGYTGNSQYCNRPIVISYGGRTANAVIKDSCVACSNWSPWALDLSTGLFEFFAPLSVGVLSIDWSFTDGQNAPQTTTKHTSTHHTTSTHHSTSTHSTTPTTTKLHTTSTSTSTSSTATSTSSPSLGNLESLNQIVIDFANMLEEATKA